MIKLLSLFSGIGAFEKALSNLNIPFELVNYCEFDKYAAKAYSILHNVSESKNLGDITKVNVETLPMVDMVTYGFPCQDISLAGKQRGLFNSDGTQTRSGLFFNALDIIRQCRPKVAIAENVKNLTSDKFSEQFNLVLDALEESGYNNYWKVLNSKDYGVPQNRERVFIISIRKDCDTGSFAFPHPFKLNLRLKDILEDEVDPKYFINKHLNMEMKENYIQYDNSGKGYNSQACRSYYQDGLCPTLPARNGGDKSQVVLMNKDDIISKLGNSSTDNRTITPVVQRVGNIYPSGGQNGNIYNPDGISPTISSGTTETKGNGGIGSSNAPKIFEPTVKENHGNVTAVAMRGRYSANGIFEQHIEVSDREYANALTTVQKDSMVAETPTLRIRRLTPKECFRLQGFADQDVDILTKNGISNTQLYKMAGNSITVTVLEYIYKMLFDSDGNLLISDTLSSDNSFSRPLPTFIDRVPPNVRCIPNSQQLINNQLRLFE